MVRLYPWQSRLPSPQWAQTAEFENVNEPALYRLNIRAAESRRPLGRISSRGVVFARGGADIGRRGAVMAPKHMIEVGQIAKASLESDRTDHMVGKTRIGQTTMHACKPLVQD